MDRKHLPQEPDAGGLRDRDVAGAKESPVYAILELRKKIDAIDPARRIPHRPAHGGPA